MDEIRSKQGPRRAYFWFAATAVVCCAADLASKHYVIDLVRQSPGEPMEKRVVVWPGRFEFRDRLNDAGLWSIGHGDPRSNMILAAAGFGIVAMIVAIGLKSLQPQDRFFAVVLGAILGGAAGNLHDRIRYEGVRDFIQVYLWNGYAYPTFNVADSCLVCAALVWVGSWIFLPSDPAPKTQAAVADA